MCTKYLVVIVVYGTMCLFIQKLLNRTNILMKTNKMNISLISFNFTKMRKFIPESYSFFVVTISGCETCVHFQIIKVRHCCYLWPVYALSLIHIQMCIRDRPGTPAPGPQRRWYATACREQKVCYTGSYSHDSQGDQPFKVNFPWAPAQSFTLQAIVRLIIARRWFNFYVSTRYGLIKRNNIKKIEITFLP